jgi:hypothetical protein
MEGLMRYFTWLVLPAALLVSAAASGCGSTPATGSPTARAPAPPQKMPSPPPAPPHPPRR